MPVAISVIYALGGGMWPRQKETASLSDFLGGA